MYQISNNVAYINGSNGQYQGKINSTGVQYGRNAISNYKEYIGGFKYEPVELPKIDGLVDCSFEEFDKKMADLNKALMELQKRKFNPLDFECRYMPKGSINKQALMGAAYEEMGQRTSVSLREMNNSCQKAIDQIYHEEKNKEEVPKADVSGLDINKDGRINIAEYSAAILAKDALSKSPYFDSSNIDGSFTKHGENALFALNTEELSGEAGNIYLNLYAKFGLAKAQSEFLQNKNNLV